MPKREHIDVPEERGVDISDVGDDLMDEGNDSATQFHCKRCSTSFDSETNIELHEQNCAKLKPHVCDICGAGFSRISTVKHHKSVHTDQRPFSCPICARTFRLERMLKTHIPTHEFGRPRNFACSECGKTYMNAKGLDQHVTLTHKEKTHQCRICNKMFANSNRLKRHLSFHLDIRNFSCPECDFKFKTAQALKRHSWVHNKNDPVKCEVCGKQVADNARLKEHMNKRHSDKPKEVYPCDLCDVKLSSKTSFLEHKRRHLGVKLFECPDCDKKFYDARSLRSHSATHSDKREFKCTHCDKDFKWLTNLKEHINDIHTVTELKFSCPSCEMKFKTARYLKRHQRIHNNRERKFVCEVCSKGFTSRNILKGHLKTHADIRPFACEMCPKKFRTKACLADHMKTHTGERAFACTYCEKRFGYSSSLVKHIRIHTGERPYVCFICQRGFLEPKPLHSHMEKVHGATDSKPKKVFKCTLCYKKLCSKGSLETHMRTHTDNSEFKCPVCFKILACRGSMKVHMRNQHKAKVPEHKCTVCHKKYVNAQDLERHINAMHNYSRARVVEDVKEKLMTCPVNEKSNHKINMKDMNNHIEGGDHDRDNDSASENDSVTNGHSTKMRNEPRISDHLFKENNPDMSKDTIMKDISLQNVIKNCLKRKCFVKLDRITVPSPLDYPHLFVNLNLKSRDSNLKNIRNSDNLNENDSDDQMNDLNNPKTEKVLMNFEIKSEPDVTIHKTVKTEIIEEFDVTTCLCDSPQNTAGNTHTSNASGTANNDTNITDHDTAVINVVEHKSIITANVAPVNIAKKDKCPEQNGLTQEAVIRGETPTVADETPNASESKTVNKEDATGGQSKKTTYDGSAENRHTQCECMIEQFKNSVPKVHQRTELDTLIIPQQFAIKEEV